MKYIILLTIACLFYASNAQAYVGPGAGLGAIGVIIGIVLSVVMAIIGVFWYPIKRMFKKKDNNESIEDSIAEETSAEKESVANDDSDETK